MSDDNIKKPKDSEKGEGKVESNLKIGEVVNNENESIEINKFNDLTKTRFIRGRKIINKKYV